jgi:hypothetical protein
VNEHITGESKKITFSVMLRKDSIEPSVAGNFAQSTGSTIPLRLYGRVWQPIDRSAGIWEVRINPTAVY